MSHVCRMSTPGAVHQTVSQQGEWAGVRSVCDDAGGSWDAGHRLQARPLLIQVRSDNLAAHLKNLLFAVSLDDFLELTELL